MEAKRTQMPFDQALMRELRFGGLAQENLDELVGIVAGIQKVGLKRLKVFPKGVPPVVDGIRVSGVLEAGEISNVLSQILTTTPRLGGVVVFPYGIPWPDIFRVDIELGPQVEASARQQF